MRYLILALLLLQGCAIIGVEHTVYGGVTRSHSGGEVYAEQPSGHQEQGGSWYVGSALKTIWRIK